MKKLLTTPLLPEKKVTTVLMSGKYPEIVEALRNKFNIDVVETSENNMLEASISTHADCMFVQLDKNTVFIEKNNYNELVNYLTKMKGEFNKKICIIPIKEEIKSPYPLDISLNLKVIGDKIICNTSYISDEIKQYAYYHKTDLVHCNQGYAACSTVVLNDNALITDDESIYLSCTRKGIECIKINKGSIILDGYNYGFIGGTCGMIDKNLIAFTGSLQFHRDAEQIISFLNKHGIEFVELTDNPLIDIGGIIPIFEEI